MAMVDFRFPLFEHFWPIEGHRDRMVMLNMVTNIEVFQLILLQTPQNTIQALSDTLQTYPDTFQTLSER